MGEAETNPTAARFDALTSVTTRSGKVAHGSSEGRRRDEALGSIDGDLHATDRDRRSAA